MATSNLRFRIIGDDDASSAFLKVAAAARLTKSTMDDLGSSSLGLTKMVGGAGLIPVVAGAAAAVTELGTSLGAATLAGGAFGVSVGGFLKRMADQQQSISTTQKSLDGLAKGTTAYKDAVTKLHLKQQSFNQDFGVAAGAFSDMKYAFDRFLTATGPVAKGVIAQGFTLIATALPKLVPVSNAAGKAVGGLISDLTSWVRSPEFSHLLDWLAKSGPKAITAFGVSIGHLVHGLGELFANFAGPGEDAAKTLEHLSKAFDKWAGSKGVSDSVNKFLSYVGDNGPKITSVLQSLADAAPKLAESFGKLGSANLTVTSKFLELIAGLPQGAFNVVVDGMFGIVAASKALTILQGLRTMFVGATTAVTALGDACIGTRIQLGLLAASQNKLRIGAAVVGMAALAGSTKTSNDAMKALLNIGGSAAAGFAAGGPIGAAVGAFAGTLLTVSQHAKSAGDKVLDAYNTISKINPIKVATQGLRDLKSTLDQVTGAYTAATRAAVLQKLQQAGLVGQAKSYGISARTLVNAALGQKDAMQKAAGIVAVYKRQIGDLNDQIRHLNMNPGLSPEASAANLKQITALEKQKKELQGNIATLKQMPGVLDNYGKKVRQAAQATTDYTGKLQGIPANVKTNILQNGIPTSLRGIAQLIAQYKLTPKQVQTLISASGVPYTVSQIQSVVNHLNSLHDKNVNITTTYVTRHVNGTTYATGGHLTGGSGGGGMGSGSGGGGARGAGRDLGTDLLRGIVDGIGSHFVLVSHALDKVTAYIQKQKQKLQSLTSTRNQFAAGFQNFGGSAFGADYGQDASGNPIAPTIASILQYQSSQRSTAATVRTDVHKLIKMGLSPALLKQLQAAGPAGLPVIEALAGATRKQIQQYNALNKATQHDLRVAGMAAGNAIYGKQIVQTRNNEDLAKRIAHELRKDAHHGKGEYVVVKVNGNEIIRAVRKDKHKRGKPSSV